MPLREKAKTDGLSVLMSFHLGDIRLCHSFWPSQSRRRTSPETDGAEADGPETEGVLLLPLFLNIVEGLSGCYCLIMFEWCVWVQQCLSVVDDSSGVGEWVVGWVCMGAC